MCITFVMRACTLYSVHYRTHKLTHTRSDRIYETIIKTTHERIDKS